MDKDSLYKIAFGLALFTILFNIAEGLISTYFGFVDESISLFGFGIDSFIEVISGVGIAHMIIRIWKNQNTSRDNFERTALRVTGTAFYLLVVGLVFTSIYNIIEKNKPETTFWGVIISTISLLTMWLLMSKKRSVGNKLNSEAILADAECTKTCLYMSIVLLIASAIYELTGMLYIDSLGALGLAYLSFKEGRECFIKAKSDVYCSCED
ncbi:MAG: cation transporter [Ignavibacteria bacterium]|nr:cation transporter [Ignavibacteria bacterium]